MGSKAPQAAPPNPLKPQLSPPPPPKKRGAKPKKKGGVPAKKPPVDLSEACDQVVQLMIGGQSEAGIRAVLASAFPQINPQDLLVAATDHFDKASRCDRSVVIGWALEAYRELYRLQLNDGDFDGARKSLKELVATATRFNSVHDQDDQDVDGQSEPAAAAE